MSSPTKKSHVFKVPKIKTKENLERVSTKSEQYKSDILPIIASNFKRPLISQKNMEISAAWLINNSSAEERHFNCRKKMRKIMPMMSYSVGFLFFNSVYKLQKVAKSGQIVKGNITDSHLATSSMGVSLCQFADIYHPGNNDGAIPNEGFLLIIKYLKGKINYVPLDPLPMDPQPEFDCHMVKNPVIDNNTCYSKAFHNSQIFIYEYSEDYEILDCPSQILPFAAIKFWWSGKYLFKRTESSSRQTTTLSHERLKESKKYFKSLEDEKKLANLLVHQKNASSIINFNLCIKGLSNIEMKSTAFLYFTNPVTSLLRSDEDWIISGVIEIKEFEKEFKRLQINWNNIITPTSSKDMLDPLSQQLIISLNRPNVLSSADTDSESSSFNPSLNIPQFVTYTRIVLDSSNYSTCLIKHLNVTKSMGFINRPYDPEISILIFPNGYFSKKLGIPSVEDSHYFHALVFHAQNPQFIILNSSADNKREKDIYFSCLSAFKKQSIQSKLNSLQPIINADILRQTLKSQIEVQKTFLFNLVKQQVTNNMITYKICFNAHCENHDCWYHNPSKKPKLSEITNTDLTKSNFDIVPKKKRKIIEQKCLSDKLFDYFKKNSDEVLNHTENVTKDSETSISQKLPVTSQNIKDIENVTTNKEINVKNISVNNLIIPKVDPKNSLCYKINEKAISGDKCLYRSDGCEKKQSLELITFVDYIELDELEVRGSVEDISINYKESNFNRNLLSFDQNDHGLFHSLNFKNYSKAEYLNNGNLNIVQFKNPTSTCFVDERRSSTKDMWSFNCLPFKRVQNWPGVSFYS